MIHHGEANEVLAGRAVRSPMIVGNWKMNKGLDEALALVKQLRSRARVVRQEDEANRPGDESDFILDLGLESLTCIQAVLCPPTIALATLKEALRDTSIKLGAQNIHFEDKGSYTGETSARMLVGLCEYVFIGHAERRRYFGETDQTINWKIIAALSAGLKPIVCVGEDRDDYSWDVRREIIGDQLAAYFAGATLCPGLVIVYEPVWAIGSQRSVKCADASRIMRFIREQIALHSSETIAEETSILIGGSINPRNVAGYMRFPEIDGAGVGAASLVAESFIQIAAQISRLKGVLQPEPTP